MLQHYAIAFRGDDRDPHEILPSGFRRRHDSFSYYERRWRTYLDESFQAQVFGGDDDSSDSDVDIEDVLGFTPAEGVDAEYPNFRYSDGSHQAWVRLQDTGGQWHTVIVNLTESAAQLYQRWLQEFNQPLALRPRGDIDPHTAVCVTDRVETAVLFPLPSTFPQNARDETWLYVIQADSVYVTWQQQVVHQQHVVQILGRSRELAARDIPVGHVFAAVRIVRRWRRSLRHRHRTLADWRAGAICTMDPAFTMNPVVSNQPQFQQFVQNSLQPYLGRTFNSETFDELPDHVITG